MKIRKKPIIITVCSLVLCLSLVIGIAYRTPLTTYAVEVTANMSRMTSAGGGVSQTQDNVYAFTEGAQIQIVGWTGEWGDYPQPCNNPEDAWWNSAVSTFNGRKWKTDPYMRWQNGEGLEHHFVSYWPANLADPNSNLTSVPINLTGSAEDDILLAHWSGKRPDDNQLNMEFEHLMARFDVHLYFCDEYTDVDIDSISIETNLQNKATVDLLAGEVTSTSGSGIKMEKSQHQNNSWHWSGTCITVPHDFYGELLTIKFKVDGAEKTITYEHPAELQFLSNQRVTLSLMVGKDKVELADVNVGEWEQEDINAGEAEESFADVSTTNAMTTVSPYADSTPTQLYYTVTEQLKRPSFSGNLTVTGELTGEQLKMLNQAIMDHYDDDERLNALWLPDMTTLPDEAFMNNDNVNILGFPKVSEIGNRAFQNCSWLSHIVFYNPVTKVGTNAFSKTTQMRIIISPNQKQLIGDNTNGWTAGTAAAQTGENATFCGYPFAEIAH